MSRDALSKAAGAATEKAAEPLGSFHAWWSARAPAKPFWLFFAASLLFTFGYAAFFFLYNLFLLDLRYSEGAIGTIASVMSFGSLAGTLPAGLLASRWGLRRVMILGILLTALFSSLRTCLPSYPSQLLLAFCAGFTLCTWAVCLAPVVARLTDESNRLFAFSLMFSSGIGMAGLGGLAAGILPGYLQALPRYGGLAQLSPLQAKQVTLLLACAFATLSVFPIAGLHLGFREKAPTLLRRPHPFLLRFLPAVALWSFITGSFPPFANIYFTRHFGLPLHYVGYIFSVAQAAQFGAVLLAPLLLRKLGLGLTVMWTQMIAGAELALLSVTHTATYAVWIYWAYISVQYMSEPGIFSLLMDRVPRNEQSNASALNFFAVSVAQSIASFWIGRSITRLGYAPVLGSLAVFACATALAFRRLAKQSHEQSAAYV